MARAIGRLGDLLPADVDSDLAAYFVAEYRSEVDVIHYASAPAEEMDALRRRAQRAEHSSISEETAAD